MLIAGGVVALAGAVVLTAIVRSRNQAVSAAFWFERVTFDESEPRADRLGHAITEEEIKTIEAIARALLRLHGHHAGTETGRDRQCAV